ncbi:hypothetical protein [Streptomyces fulvorobeus]|nr:hypothetical protein [Streptomyces fulvorobeus]NYE44172.1 hypothetical protein [Streptomyces fulvorobeus]
MGISGDQREERGRRTATANTAGAVITKVSETSDGPPRGAFRVVLR